MYVEITLRSLSMRWEMKRKGFTLIELMVVVVIIGILSSIAIPKFRSVQDRAYAASCRCNMRSLGSAEALYYAKYSVFTIVGNLAHSEVMGNAHLLECPSAGVRYVAVLANNTYSIPCPNEDPNHGSINDGVPSW